MQHPLEAPEVRGALLHALLLALHLPGQHQAQVRRLQVQCLQELLLLPEAREGVDLLRLPASQVSGQVDLRCPLVARSPLSQVGAAEGDWSAQSPDCSEEIAEVCGTPRDLYKENGGGLCFLSGLILSFIHSTSMCWILGNYAGCGNMMVDLADCLWG